MSVKQSGVQHYYPKGTELSSEQVLHYRLDSCQETTLQKTAELHYMKLGWVKGNQNPHGGILNALPYWQHWRLRLRLFFWVRLPEKLCFGHASRSRPKMYVPSRSVKGCVIIFPSSCSFPLGCFYDRICKEEAPSGLDHHRALSSLGIYRY